MVGLVLGVAQAFGADAGPRQVDVPRVTAAGVRVLDGKYVRLLTDLPASPAVDELPRVFDAAVPLWAEYFHVPDAQIAGKRWLACVVANRQRFAALGLTPTDNPDFINGYSHGWELWLVDQPSDYYRRHLLLHEGTHAFMQTQLGGCGPAWYMEGVAELLGTHEWRDGRLKMGIFPQDKKDVPMWGRIKLVREAVAAGTPWSLDKVLETDNSHEMSTEQYAWAWALAAMLDGDPRYREGFRKLSEEIPRKSDFTGMFRTLTTSKWGVLNWEWQTFISQLNYGGYDFERMAIVYANPDVSKGGKATRIRADRGWQAIEYGFKAGQTYHLTASGRYQIAGAPSRGRASPAA